MFRTDLLSIIRSFNTVYTAVGICHGSYFDCLLARSGWNSGTSLADSQHNYHDKYLLLCIQCWNFWWWTVDLSETCRVLYQNKFEKLCISLACIIRIYHDARSSECQCFILIFHSFTAGVIWSEQFTVSLDKKSSFFSEYCRNGMIRQGGNNVAYSVEGGFAAKAYRFCTLNWSASLIRSVWERWTDYVT
jgi:hypothetical protein